MDTPTTDSAGIIVLTDGDGDEDPEPCELPVYRSTTQIPMRARRYLGYLLAAACRENNAHVITASMDLVKGNEKSYKIEALLGTISEE